MCAATDSVGFKAKQLCCHLVSGLMGLLLCVQAGAGAPEPGVELFVPTATQGSTDLLARMLAQGLNDTGKWRVSVHNLPGHNGALAAQRVASAPPDGSALLLATPSSHGIAAALHKNLPYDSVDDFTPILRFAAAPYVLVVKAGGPESLSELKARVKSGERVWRYASTGVGGPHHLVAEHYFRRAGLQLQHVPMAGGEVALQSVERGEVDVMLPAAVLAISKIQAGQLKALAVTGTRRLSAMPQVPTFAELDMPVNFVSWYGLLAPAGMSPQMVTTLTEAVQQTLKAPSAQNRMAQLAVQPTSETGAQFAAVISDEIHQWKTLVNVLAPAGQTPKD